MTAIAVRGAVTFLALALLLQFSAPASGQEASQQIAPAKIAVIDVSRAERDSVVWQSLRQEFEKRVGEYQSVVRAEQSVLEEERETLESQRNLLSVEAFMNRKRDFNERVGALQRTAQQHKQELDEAYASARNQIRTALREVVLELATEMDINLIISNSPGDRLVLMADNELSITDLALARLNEKITTITLPEITLE